MLLDLIQPNNLNTYNIKLAHTIGLQSAIYCSELLNILGQVTKKNKFINNDFFRLDRKYVEERTTLTPDEQVNIDVSLSKINLITRDTDDPDVIKIDINLLSNIVTNSDMDINYDIKKKTKLKNSKEARETKKNIIINSLKNSIVCTNDELLNSLRDWVDGVYANPKGYLSKALIKTFQDTLNTYTQGNLDVALDIVKIATVHSFIDCAQAIRWYERDRFMANQMQQTKLNKVRVTEQTTATNDSLSQEVF